VFCEKQKEVQKFIGKLVNMQNVIAYFKKFERRQHTDNEYYTIPAPMPGCLSLHRKKLNIKKLDKNVLTLIGQNIFDLSFVCDP